MADEHVGRGYYKDNKGIYQLVNGKKQYFDPKLNTDNSKLITTRGGTPIYQDTNGQYFTYDNGVKTDFGFKFGLKDTNPFDVKDPFDWRTYKEKTEDEQASGNEDPNIDDNQDKGFEGIPDDIGKRMKDLQKTLSAVDNKFNKGRAVYTQYLKFIVNGQTLVDTTSKNWNTNNMISFSHDISGAGQANKFTLDIAFIPNDRSINDVLTIEKLLLDAVNIVDSNGELKPDASGKENFILNCTYQYGYGDCDIRSPLYTGFIEKYTPILEDGWLRYTITGVAGLYNTKEIKLSPKKEYFENGGDTNPLVFLENIFKTEFDVLKYNFVITDNVEHNNATGTVMCDSDYTCFEQKNIFEILTDVCNGMMSKEEQDCTKNGLKFVPTQKQVYSYYVVSSTDKETNGTVYLYKMPSLSQLSNDKDTALKPDCNITFNWFAPSNVGANFLVKSWKPELRGEFSMSFMLNYLTTGDVFDTMDQDGNIVKVIGMGATRLGVNRENTDGDTDKNNLPTVNSMQEYAKWSYVTQYPHEATLVVQGLPCEVPIIGKIKITAKMGNFNTSHQSSGIYIILGKKDIMNSGGFVTEFKLRKLFKHYDPDPVTIEEFDVDGKKGQAIYDKDHKLVGVELYDEETIPS